MHPIPATYVNRFHVWVDGDNVKIAFGESGQQGDVLHSAVFLSVANAKELGTLLTRLLASPSPPSQDASGGNVVPIRPPKA
jgi:hypothetical protein